MLSPAWFLVLCLPVIGATSPRPHIIFILADDLGWNDVSFHGSNQIPTPNLDALASAGITLNNYYVAPICTPSTSALMTGRHPIHTGMHHNVILAAEPYGLSLNEKLLSQYLKELGYATHIVGKWHLGFFQKEYTPLYRGFDSHCGYYTGAEDYYEHTKLESLNLWGYDFYKNGTVYKEAFGKYSTQVFTEEAVDIIANHNANQTKDSLWEGGVRGNGIVWSSNFKQQARVSNQLMDITDWLPTLLHAAGYDMNSLSNIDGIDMWDALSNNLTSPRTEVLHNIDDQRGIAALRMGDYKVVIGVTYGGKYNGWLSPPEIDEETADYSAKSKLHTVFREIHKQKGISEPLEMNAVQKSAKVTCGPIPANASTSCLPKQKPCLFNVVSDPCEFHNIAEANPDLLKTLLDRLAVYNTTVVLPRNKPGDPMANPLYHDNVWGPWVAS